MLSCRKCKEVDVLTADRIVFETGALPTVYPRWINPCKCPALVHRTCLEKSLSRANPRIGSAWISLDDPLRVHTLPSQIPGSNAQSDTYTMPGVLGISLGKCERCGQSFHSGFRPPDTVSEFVRLALVDLSARARAAKCVRRWFLCLGLTLLLDTFYTFTETHTYALTWPQPGGAVLAWFVLQQSVLLDLFGSDRFAFVVNRLWRGPYFRFYCKLYLYFLLACAGVVMFHTPLLCRYTIAAHTHVCGYGNPAQQPLWWYVLGLLNVLAYAVVSNVVIFIFWKTNYRILSVASGTVGQHPIIL